jgi:hypothetical protein
MCFVYDAYYNCGCFWMPVTDPCIAGREGFECTTVYLYTFLPFVCIDHIAGLAEPRYNVGLWLGPATPGSDQNGAREVGNESV